MLKSKIKEKASKSIDNIYSNVLKQFKKASQIPC